ncbi:MAG: fibronectin type III domain-containing protein [Eubacterium sp.]
MKRFLSIILSFVLIFSVFSFETVSLASDEAVIHFDMSQRATLYKGSTGFLYGEAEINVPSIDLLQGLKPDTMVQKAYGGKQHPTGDAVRTKSALESAGVRDMQIYLQDYYLEWPYDAPMKDGEIDLDAYQKTVEKILYSMICTKALSTTEGAFKGSDGSYYVLNKKVASKYSYVLFNEPDQIWYGGNLTGLKNAWKKIYDAVHKIDPNARCVGPNYSGFNEYQYSTFIKLCSKEKCLPEIISWHELGDISLTDFKSHYSTVQSLVKQYYTSSYFADLGRSFDVQLMVNEYARHYDIGSAGGLVKWLAMFEDADMSACMAYWAMANSLNEMAADQNSPTSTWWLYHWYAQMTGEQCPLSSPSFEQTRFYGLASYDKDINTAYVIFGGEEEKTSEAVVLDNISSTSLAQNGKADVKLYGVSYSGQLGTCYSPELIFNDTVKMSADSLTLSVENTDEMDAYFAVVTPSDDSSVPADMNGVRLSKDSYEAEDAELINNATAYDKNWWSAFATSGRKDVGSINDNGDGVRFTIDVKEDGLYNLSLFYSLQAPYVNPKTLEPDANGQNRGIGKTLPFGITVDDGEQEEIYLESTATWWYKNHYDYEVHLTAGKHTVTCEQINGNESTKGNLQLVCALDKLDVVKLNDEDLRYDFDIDLAQMNSFKTANGYEITAIAPKAGYYTITCDGDISVSRQSVNYAGNAKSTSTCSTYEIPTGTTLYLSQGANTLTVITDADCLYFDYQADLTKNASAVIKANEMFIHGTNPVLKSSTYSDSGYVISNVGIGQNPSAYEKGSVNYIEFKVNALTDGLYNFAVRYSNDEPAPVMLKSNGDTYVHPYNIDLVERYAQFTVNGGAPETVYFKNTLSWDTFKTLDIQLKLNKGANTIRIYNDNSYQFSSVVNSTAPEIDTVTVSRLTYDGTRVSKYSKSTLSNKHTYKASSTKTTPATASADGKIVTTYTCSVCKNSYSKTTKIIPKVSSVKLSATAYTYNGNARTPTVTVKDRTGKTLVKNTDYTVSYAKGRKNVGKYAVKVTFKGNYSGTKTLYFTIKPKATSISSVSAKSKGFTVKWKKQSTQTTGYQIQYSTSSNFSNAKTVTVSKNSTTSKTVSKLKAKKKYYVRVRTYKTVNGTKYYSAWSKYRTVKTKA